MANLSMESVAIPARSFYSGRQSSSLSPSPPKAKTSPPHKPALKKTTTTSNSTSPKSKPKSPQFKSINRGVAHKIRRRSHRQDTAFSKPLHSHYVDINFILGNIKNEKLRNRIETKREEKQQIEKVHKIFRTGENPIALARPLRALNIGNDTNQKLKTNAAEDEELSPLPFEAEAVEAGFSDLDSLSDDNDDDLTEKDLAALNPYKSEDFGTDNFDEETMNDAESLRSASELQENIETASVSSSRSATPNRKFFKSGQTASIPKEVRITENIRAMVCNGRMTLISEKKFRPKKNSASAAELADAKAAVNNILKKFDDDADDANLKVNSLSPKKVQASVELSNENSINDIELPEPIDYSEFRKRIPYKTDDPVRIEEQHFLLDFLITHSICNEENFLIFIADPESHRDEAAGIVHKVLSSVGCAPEVGDETVEKKNGKGPVESGNDFETDSALALSSEDFGSNESNENTSTPLNAVEQPQEKLFPIFYNDKYKPLYKLPTQRHQKQRNWNAGFGLNQLQIDAGQKDYGAKQCKQCGLVYTAHEPEEEKLHRDFHSSLHVLRFKGWIDEDRIADFQEWGRDGRIIRLTDSTHIKRRERLNEILKVVDKELGFSSYIIPKVFVAFLAVRNCQIVGVCLVQPLNKANKYFCSDSGVDCCTIEEFEAKCGISRIWVSPLHRRLHIGKKLIEAVRMNTIIGEEIPIDKIAFSAPTEDGKRFAQHVTGMENFLVYQ